MDIAKLILGMLLKINASALSTYKKLHQLSAYQLQLQQPTPSFPPEVVLDAEPLAKLLAQKGRKALPMPPSRLRRVTEFCIRHEAASALDWLAVHAGLDTLYAGHGACAEAELRWLMKWTRAAPRSIGLCLDGAILDADMVEVLCNGLKHNPCVTSLSLKRCEISSRDLRALLKALRFNDTMQNLRLPYTSHKTSVVRAIQRLQKISPITIVGARDSVSDDESSYSSEDSQVE